MTIDPSLPILAVDTSYAVYHQFYATRRRRSMFSEDATHGDQHASPQAVGRALVAAVARLARRFAVPETNVVFLLDCPRVSIWRRAVYEPYKQHRVKPADFDRAVFPHILNDTLPGVRGGTIVSVPTAEGDDLAGVAASWARARGCPSLTVVTGDSDLVQLCGDGVRVVNMHGDCMLARSKHRSAAELLACKILAGDKSDGIPSVGARVGPKTSLALYADPERLARLLASDPSVRLCFERNTTLVDLRCTPDGIRRDAVAQLDRAARTGVQTTFLSPLRQDAAELDELLEQENEHGA
jgi:5'-3' exonuclease